jgi:hypothetical protein
MLRERRFHHQVRKREPDLGPLRGFNAAPTLARLCQRAGYTRTSLSLHSNWPASGVTARWRYHPLLSPRQRLLSSSLVRTRSKSSCTSSLPHWIRLRCSRPSGETQKPGAADVHRY